MINIIGLTIVLFVVFSVGVYIGIKQNTIPLNRNTPNTLRYFVNINGEAKVYYLVASEKVDTWTYKITLSKFKDRLSAQIKKETKQDEQEQK